MSERYDATLCKTSLLLYRSLSYASNVLLAALGKSMGSLRVTHRGLRLVQVRRLQHGDQQGEALLHDHPIVGVALADRRQRLCAV